MNRRKRFEQVMNHQQPDGLLVDLGGCPLSSMEGNSDKKLMEALGITPEKDDRVYRFGDVRQLDERMLKAMDIDTHSVGDLLHPPESHFRQISDTEYIDEWGIHFFTGLYWEIFESPLQDATLEELQQYRFPDSDSIDPRLIQSYVDRARYLYEETDYVVCANHPVYQIPLMEKFGLSAYGCCEDLTHKIKYLRRIKNLRRIGVSPFADPQKCAEQIDGDYIISYRPNPSTFIARGVDEEYVRRKMLQRLDCFKQNGCYVEVEYKDVETVNHDPHAMARLVQITREELERAGY